MASVPYPPSLQIAGVNLDNYFPTKCSYDSIIYVHKKFLPHHKEELKNKHEIPEGKKKWDKGQQFDSEKLNTEAYRIKETVKNYNDKDPIVEQTIRFAKGIIPLTIPPSTDVSPHPLYTIKGVKKLKKKLANVKSESAKDATYEKGNYKNKFYHLKTEKLKRHREDISVRETVYSSQSNTLDDINENRTLSCTLSEISERKHHKEDRHCKRNKRNEMQKVAVSESFEAVATEFMNTSNNTKIKIHLMNERDKNLFCQNIQTPVIESLKECIIELNNNNLKALQCMKTSIEQQTKKMDIIFNKLTGFEEILSACTKPNTPKVTPLTTAKPSKLEELSADIFQVKTLSSSDEEELGQIDLLNKSEKNKSVKEIKCTDKNFIGSENKKIENLGCGEEVPAQLKTQLGVKPDRLNRAPARFCWTDAGRSN